MADELILVNAEDEEVGTMEKMAAHQNGGHLHRAFSVFLFNEKGELLLQQRSDAKPTWPGFWSNTCCSHPRPGESIEEAAKRRLKEELNVTAELEFFFKFQYRADYDATYCEHEVCHVLVGLVTDEPTANQDEIADLKWVDMYSVDEVIAPDPDIHTPWFKIEWARMHDEHWSRLEELVGR